MTALATAAAVFAGGLAAVARYLLALAVPGRSLPWAVLLVNVAGSVVGGLALGLADAGIIDGDLRLVLLGGVAGGLSTFSTWSVETVQLVQAGRWRTAAISVSANLVLGILAAAAGFGIAAAITS